MTKKLITLIMAVLLPLFAFQMNAGESFVYYNHPYGTCYSDAV